jgi:transposase-like protein
MKIITNAILHPSKMYPRQTKGEQITKSTCPTCKSRNVEVVVISQKGMLKRTSTCLDCKTVWNMRTAPMKIRYEQEFYK